MSVNKVASGKYQARVKLPNGTVRSKCFSRKVDAKKWEHLIISKLNDRGELFLSEDPKKLLSDASQEWLHRKVFGNKASKTALEYSGTVKNYIIPFLGCEPIGRLHESHGDMFIKLLQEVPLDPTTINKRLLILKMILNFCVSEGWITKSPFEKIKTLKVGAKGFDFLNRNEIQQLLDANRKSIKTYSLLAIALNTGMRAGEICGLCWDSIDFDTGYIHVRRSVVKEGLIERTKTSKNRFVPMNTPLKSFLRELYETRGESKFVVKNKNGSHIDPSHISNRIFKKARESANLRHFKFHGLRHTYASQFMMSNGNIYELQKILGHTKLEMTEKYAHLSPAHLINAANIVQFSASEIRKFPDSVQTNLRLLK